MTALNLSRRAFLSGAAAVAIAPAIPSLPGAGTTVAAPAVAPAPLTTIWVGGHAGEFDWHPFNAKTKKDALRELMYHHSFGNEEEIEAMMGLTEKELEKELRHSDLRLERVAKMDGLQTDEIESHHWIRAGLGASCDRCGDECYADGGARAIGANAVCEECLTLGDLLAGDKWDVEVAEERLTEMFIDHDCDEGAVFALVSRSCDPNTIGQSRWIKCLAEARAEL